MGIIYEYVRNGPDQYVVIKRWREEGRERYKEYRVSFKYGDQEREEKGRHFTDLKEMSLTNLVSTLDNIEILNMWITNDVRPNRSDRWLNAILRKI